MACYPVPPKRVGKPAKTKPKTKLAKGRVGAATPALKLRELTAAEVTFTVELEEEDIPVAGSFMSGDEDYAEQDQAIEDAINERLIRGDTSAWCCLKVTASWNGFTGVDYLGGCSFADDIDQPVEAQAIEMADDHDMKGEALIRLNRALSDMFAKLAPLTR